jgi:hypothetical protein
MTIFVGICIFHPTLFYRDVNLCAMKFFVLAEWSRTTEAGEGGWRQEHLRRPRPSIHGAAASWGARPLDLGEYFRVPTRHYKCLRQLRILSGSWSGIFAVLYSSGQCWGYYGFVRIRILVTDIRIQSEMSFLETLVQKSIRQQVPVAHDCALPYLLQKFNHTVKCPNFDFGM